MTKDIFRQIAVFVSLIITVIINSLANILPINGLTTAEISDSFDVFFVPAGYVFSIWGLIYLALLAYALFQLLPAQRQNPRLQKTGWLFVLGCLVNSSWIFFWHYGAFALSVLAMLILLSSLIAIYLYLGVGRVAVSRTEKWLVHLPFSIYLGWITVATIANITIFLDFINWNGWGLAPQRWTVIMLVVAAVVAAVMAKTRRDIAYLLVLVWAFAGIGIEQADTALVANSAWAAAAFVALLVLITAVQKFRNSEPLIPALS